MNVDPARVCACVCVWYLRVVGPTGLADDDEAGGAGVVQGDALQTVHQPLGSGGCHELRTLTGVRGMTQHGQVKTQHNTALSP